MLGPTIIVPTASLSSSPAESMQTHTHIPTDLAGIKPFRRARRFSPFCTVAALSALAAASPGVLALEAKGAAAADSAPASKGSDLMDLDLDALANVKVTSVSKKAEKASDAAAAIAVVSSEDIRRSGVTSIPEALRLVPGLEVARINAHTWGVSSRGFNNEYANKLLVMIDGRSVYNPIFSGTYWDMQHVLMEDIDRIEVIRGPGATVWGANAVNGVINIITKSTKDTQGGLLSVSGGTEDLARVGGRFGGKLSDNATFRIYGNYQSVGDSSLMDGLLPAGSDGHDANWVGQGGFRMDWSPDEAVNFTLQGDYYVGAFSQYDSLGNPPWQVGPGFSNLARTLDRKDDIQGGNLLARWTRTFSEDSSLSAQAYFDRYDRDQPFLRQQVDTLDSEIKYDFKLGERQALVAGVGYRVYMDDLRNSWNFAFTPDHSNRQIFSTFIQDDIQLLPEKVKLTVGTKLEHNDYTGFEVQPSARLAWKPVESQTVWASVARAVRTPNRLEDGYQFNYLVTPNFAPPASTLPLKVNRNSGPGNLDAEVLMAYELGYRIQPTRQLYVDIAAFYNDYNELIDYVRTPTFTEGIPSYKVSNAVAGNYFQGNTYGAEVALTYQPSAWWRLQANYTYLNMDIDSDVAGADATKFTDRNPGHQIQFRSSFDLPHNVQLDLLARYVTKMDGFTRMMGGAYTMPEYWSADVRLAWKPCKDVELSIVGQNLLDEAHPEFNSVGIYETERAVSGKLTWAF